jgi:phosphoribosylformimino-5-aminoimidazole carboxamide ribotide isomerase
MRVYAAVDLRGGAAVQWVGGRPESERVRLPDPAAVADRWLDAGFRHLHVVDLDAALGTGDNAGAIADIARVVAGRRAGPATLQVGGGIRDEAAIERVLALGAERVVVGTRGVEDRPWLEAVAAASPGRIVLAADVGGGLVLTRGWTEATALEAEGFIAGLDPLPLAAVLVTDVGREGREEGCDAALFGRLAAATRHPLLAAGGIASAEDIAALTDAGAAGAVLGMALYTGRIDPADALARETT